MKVKSFNIIFKKETKREKKICLYAISSEKAIALAREMDINDIVRIEEKQIQPDDRRFAYAKDLGVSFPESFTIEDLSTLIENKKNDDSDIPDLGLITFAKNKNVIFNKYIGDKTLRTLIFKKLENEDQIAYFAFSIYKWLSDDKHTNLETHRYKEKFYEFAKVNITDEQFLKSMKKYIGDDLTQFGVVNYVDNDGDLLDRGSVSSINTIAYKKVAEYLHNEFGIMKTKSIKQKLESQYVQQTKNKGCLVFFLVGLFIPVIVMLAKLTL
ncbi:hypothetical protein [Paludibacter sp.]|uniref:hypothetical protein n=1 Tax=Paludibacter sp. TaxID=1898105 RepID=UPI0013534154|nr:hypothetical protein [Paludibacter sp.]MTK54283.1 hypothetical protein [Paludibacter sp.]